LIPTCSVGLAAISDDNSDAARAITWSMIGSISPDVSAVWMNRSGRT